MQISQATVNIRRLVASLRKLKGSIKEILIGSLLGYFVGILPAAGATPGSLMAYGVAKTMSKNPESFGKGNLSGVAAPESANNAASTGSMLPMLTLGIPGSPTTAILLGGMVIWGLEPGPRLFVDQKEFVWGLIASLYVANLFALIVNVAFIPAFIWVLRMPFAILAPMIFILCVVGGYAPTQDMHDVWLMLLFGVVGYLLRKLDYPMAAGGARHRARAPCRNIDAPVAADRARLAVDLLHPPDRRLDHGGCHHPAAAAAHQTDAQGVDRSPGLIPGKSGI